MSLTRHLLDYVVITLVSVLPGCQTAPVAAGTEVDARAEAQLRAMCQTLAAAQQFSVRVRSASEDLLVRGRLVHGATERTVLVRRPDRLAIDLRSDALRERIGFDGRSLTTFNVDQNAFSVIKVAGTLDALVDELRREWGLRVPLMDLLCADPYARLKAHMRTARYLGQTTVAGMRCHHIALQRPDAEWQLWIDASDRSLPRQIAILPFDPAQIPPRTAFFDAWDLTDPSLEQEFTVSLPPSAYEVEAVDFFGLP